MKNSFETNFASDAIDKTPFKDEPAQIVFAEWCRIHNSIIPHFISREEWEKRREEGILIETEEGKQELFLPEDLHLWEMIHIIKVVDRDAFARKPEKSDERENKIHELGTMFEKAGLYLYNYISDFVEGDEDAKHIAEEVAREFYRYGVLLQEKEVDSDELKHTTELLSEQDKTIIDKWFLGKDAYKKRLMRLGEDPSETQVEEMRKNILRVYFMALTRTGYKTEGNKPWETIVGPIQNLQDGAVRRITRAIETPERELKTAFFASGVEKLITEIKSLGWQDAVQHFLREGFDLDISEEKALLYNTLEIPRLKKELALIRQTGDRESVSAKEIEIAQKIQAEVSAFPHKHNAGEPSTIAQEQFVDCVGASILGGGLLDEVGIKYLHVDVPTHSATILLTSDGRSYFQDFRISNANYLEIKPDMLEENVDISHLARVGDGCFSITFKDWIQEDGLPVLATLNNPEIGLQCHILHNLADTLLDVGNYESAVEVYKQAISIGPKYADFPNGLALVYRTLGRSIDAVEAYKQAITINPKWPPVYNGLGNVYRDMGKYDEAVQAYTKAISLNPTYSHPHNGLGNTFYLLGRYDEAIHAYSESIRLDPTFAYAFCGLGDALSNLGRSTEAITAYTKSIELFAGDTYWTREIQERIQEIQNE